MPHHADALNPPPSPPNMTAPTHHPFPLLQAPACRLGQVDDGRYHNKEGLRPHMPATNDGQQSTHRHANKQLLIGWMAGTPGSYDDDAELQHQQGQTTTLNTTNNDRHPPTPTTAVSLQV
jgi:hypothetical protein